MEILSSKKNIIPILNNVVSSVSNQIFCDEKIKECLKDIKKYDAYTYGHSLRVCSLAIRLGSVYLFGMEDLVVLGKAAAVHDYGKITVDSTIINKNGKLTDEEYSIVKTHVVNGVQLLREKGVDEDVITCVGEHHERVDGSGYPNHLKGNEISLNGKILAVSDIFDAVTVKRVYQSSGTTRLDALALLQSANVDIDTVELFDIWFKNF